MPNLLENPPHSKTVRYAALQRPPPHPFVVPPRPLPDPLPTHRELAAAYIAHLLGDLTARHIEQLHIHIRKVCAYVFATDIDLGRLKGHHGDGATWVVLAAQVDIAALADGVEAEALQEGCGVLAEEVVVPLVGVGVDKGGVCWEGFVVIDDEGEVGDGFAAAVAGRDQGVAGLGGLRGRVDVGSPAVGR